MKPEGEVEQIFWAELRIALAKSPDGLLSIDQIKPAIRIALARLEKAND
jgi:hypothetical protein